MIRERYWFPYMNEMIEDACDKCYECKVASKEKKYEPIKPTQIPKKAWDHVAADFSGPYPDGHYNLVVIDRRTRYPVVESIPSTNFKVTKQRFKKIFATYGIPSELCTDNGPPFNSREFEQFADEEGFIHHCVTPLHPRANGEAEAFMRLVNKTEQMSVLQGLDTAEREMAMQEMLIAYRSTPHQATGVTPYKAMQYREIRTRIDYEHPDDQVNMGVNSDIDRRDAEYKRKMKEQRENKQYQKNNLILGDYVLVKQPKRNKWSTEFEPIFYMVIEIEGSKITARRVTDGRIIIRDASQFRLVNNLINNTDDGNIEQPKMPETMYKDTPVRPERISEKPVNHPDISLIESDNHIRNEATDQEEMNINQPVHEIKERPVRERKRPKKFDDYVMY